jgi:hypothetical protein
MFSAYNRQLAAKSETFKYKVEGLLEMLKNLKTDKILEFFLYVRENEDTFPSDARLKKILQAQFKRFASIIPEEQRITSSHPLTDPEIKELGLVSRKHPGFSNVLKRVVLENDRAEFASKELWTEFFQMLGDNKNFNGC